MERNNLPSMRQRFRAEFSCIPEGGLLLHGTSLNRAGSIKKHGFDPLLAKGDTLDTLNNFIYFNPIPQSITRSTPWCMRLDAGSLVRYADWAARNDLHEGEDIPVIMLVKKPKEFELTEEDKDRANRIPIFVRTGKNIQPENILDIISIKKIIKKHKTNTRSMDNAVILKIWKALQQLEIK